MALRFPLNNYTITQGFGANAAYYKQFGQNGHNGLDLGAKAGTSVYAAEAGTILFEGWGQNSSWMGSIAGVCVIINHNGLHTGYAHLASTVINRGQQVSKGQLIGYVGATGTATGPHLHFEVFPGTPNWSNGYAGRIDPMPHLSTVKTATADEIKRAYRDILERDADANGLAHYQKYTIDFVRADLSKSPEKRALDARKAEAARIAAEKASQEAAKKLADAKKAAEAQKAAEAAKKAEEARLAAEVEKARIAEEERIAREAAEARAKAQRELEEKTKQEAEKAKEEAMATTADQLKDINNQTTIVLNSNDFSPVISDQVKTIAYFVTDAVAIVAALAFTILAILGMMDGVVAVTVNTAVATAMLGLKQTFRLSAKKQ